MVKKFFTLANLLTLSRLILTFVVIYFISRSNIELAIICLVIAGISDLLDGFAARKLNQVSRYGRFFDTAVDGIFLIFVSLALVVYGYFSLGVVLVFLAGGVIRCFGYIQKKKISPTVYSKFVIVLIYVLMVLSMVFPKVYGLLKWPIAGYHIFICLIDLYRKE